MERFNEETLGRSLQKLAPWKQIAFMVQVGERMLPNYRHFSKETGFGNASILRHALNTVWIWIESGKQPDNLDDLRKACEQQAPDTEQFRSPYTSAALDAANATAAVLDALERPSEARPVDVASLARDTVDLFVQECIELDPNTLEFEEAILRHSLMQRELRRQREDLEALTKLSGTRQAACLEFRARSAGRLLGSLGSNR